MHAHWGNKAPCLPLCFELVKGHFLPTPLPACPGPSPWGPGTIWRKLLFESLGWVRGRAVTTTPKCCGEQRAVASGPVTDG